MRHDRALGMSIPDLMVKFGLSKTTIWNQVKDVHLSEETRKAIRAFKGGSRAEKIREWSRAQKEAALLLEKVDTKSMWPIVYAALYWSEGTKSSYVFTNTDPRMIQVFLLIMRENLGINDRDLDFMIRTCAPMDPLQCRSHWAKIVGVTISQIRVNHNDLHNKSKTEYGMCRITLKKGAYQLKLVHCLFRALADKILAKALP